MKKAASIIIYGDDEIIIAIDGEILEGSFPAKQRKMLEGWMAIHEDELKANLADAERW